MDTGCRGYIICFPFFAFNFFFKFHFVFKDRHAINPFLTESVFDTFTSANFESNIDALFSSSHNVSSIHLDIVYISHKYNYMCINMFVYIQGDSSY